MADKVVRLYDSTDPTGQSADVNNLPGDPETYHYGAVDAAGEYWMVYGLGPYNLICISSEAYLAMYSHPTKQAVAAAAVQDGWTKVYASNSIDLLLDKMQEVV